MLFPFNSSDICKNVYPIIYNTSDICDAFMMNEYPIYNEFIVTTYVI